MVEFTWDPAIATAVMLLGAALAYVFYMFGRRLVRSKPSAEKAKTYACGEELRPVEMHPDSEQFFSPIRRVLRPFYVYVQRAHTGILSTYLLWALAGLLLILILILVAMR